MAIKVELLESTCDSKGNIISEEVIHPITKARNVTFKDGSNLSQVIGELENEKFSPSLKYNGKSMFKIGQGDGVDVSNSVQDGVFNSCMLYGETLVNLFRFNASANLIGNPTYDKGDITVTHASDNDSGIATEGIYPLPKGDYLIMFDLDLHNSNRTIIVTKEFNGNENWVNGKELIRQQIVNGRQVIKISTTRENARILFSVQGGGTVGDVTTYKNQMVIPYKTGMENWDIPYFTGMKSVQMPVLRTCGKNLCPKMEIGSLSQINGEEIVSENEVRTPLFLLGKGNYVCSNNGVQRGTNINEYTKDGVFIRTNAIANHLFNIAQPTYIRAWGNNTNRDSFQIEQGTVPTPYEDYKTNILECMEPVELESGNTLNAMSGVVTLNSFKFNLNNSNGWIKSVHSTNEYSVFVCNEKNNALKTSEAIIMCSAFSVDNYIGGAPQNKEAIGYSNPNMGIRVSILNSKIGGTFSVNDFKAFLGESGIEVLAWKSEKQTKTIPLSNLPLAYENGHISLSSDTLIPNIEYSVPMNMNGVVETNSHSIMTQDKQINELEKLLPTLLDSHYNLSMTRFNYNRGEELL